MALDSRARPLVRCIQCARHDRPILPHRSFATTSADRQDLPSGESQLIAASDAQAGGPRRRRAAIASTHNIPFHLLPYQCFQEARQVLQEDRKEKVEEINKTRERIARLQAKSVPPENEAQREHQLRSMRKRLEDLKIFADINDPLVKKKFEDGFGDMTKPIYRHLSNERWRSYKRKILMQRLTQMNLIPDILPSIDPTFDVTLTFNRKRVQHGDIVLSILSENAPSLTIQPFEKGDRFVTIAVVNPDVPNVEKDGFDYRCHFLASNIPISPTQTQVDLSALNPETQVIQPWLPPYSQKGLPYQRLGIFVFVQPSGPSEPLDLAAIKADERYSRRLNFILRSFVTRYALQPVGADVFRTKWDEGTEGVMERAGVVGSDVEFRRKRVEPLPYQRLKGERFR